jgi:hypothetical protein
MAFWAMAFPRTYPEAISLWKFIPVRTLESPSSLALYSRKAVSPG